MLSGRDYLGAESPGQEGLGTSSLGAPTRSS